MSVQKKTQSEAKKTSYTTLLKERFISKPRMEMPQAPVDASMPTPPSETAIEAYKHLCESLQGNLNNFIHAKTDPTNEEISSLQAAIENYQEFVSSEYYSALLPHQQETLDEVAKKAMNMSEAEQFYKTFSSLMQSQIAEVQKTDALPQVAKVLAKTLDRFWSAMMKKPEVYNLLVGSQQKTLFNLCATGQQLLQDRAAPNTAKQTELEKDVGLRMLA